MKSIFIDKTVMPTKANLKKALAGTASLWETIADFTKKSFPGAAEAWKFSGENYGWSFRISDKKRVLIYLLPRDKYFKTAFVFGQKAFNTILESDISESIKHELKEAKVYAEGRGIRIEVRDKSKISDICKLLTIKISN